MFVSERGAPFSTAGFASGETQSDASVESGPEPQKSVTSTGIICSHRTLERAADAVGLKIKVHPHMLRHACGFALANAGHDTRSLQAYLGHKNIQHAVRYTELTPTRFKNFWRD